MGGREVSRPYRVWFFAEGEQYFSTEPGLCRPLKKHPIKSRIRDLIGCSLFLCPNWGRLFYDYFCGFAVEGDYVHTLAERHAQAFAAVG